MITNSIESTMQGLFGRNWRTTASAWIVAGAGFIAANPDVIQNEVIINLAKFLTFSGILSLGLNAKDKQVSGLSKKQLNEDE